MKSGGAGQNPGHYPAPGFNSELDLSAEDPGSSAGGGIHRRPRPGVIKTLIHAVQRFGVIAVGDVLHAEAQLDVVGRLPGAVEVDDGRDIGHALFRHDIVVADALGAQAPGFAGKLDQTADG